MAYLNARKKGELASDIIFHHINDSHIMDIISKSGLTLVKILLIFINTPNKSRSDEQTNRKRKRIEKSNDNVPKFSEPIVGKLKVVEENIKIM